MTASADRKQLRAILETAVDAIITIDAGGIVKFANPATEQMFLYRRDEIVGHNVSQLMPSPYRDEHDGYLSNYLETGNRNIIGIGREVTGRRKDGSLFPAHLAVSEIDLEGQQLFTGIVRDITDVKQAEAKLAQLNADLERRVEARTAELKAAQSELLQRERLATLGQVAGGIAHEIRNPLNTISTSAYYLTHATHATEEKRRQHIERISRQVSMIDSVVTALNDVAQLPPPDRQPVEIESLLKGIVKETTLPTDISIAWATDPDARWVLADQRQVSIVFRNLLRNARDAMPEGGVITLEAQRDGDRVDVSVRDTGMGIPPAVQARIWEPFFTTKARGIGLGLAICKAIVEKNQGQLSFASGPGAGSLFTVSLEGSIGHD